MAFFPGEKWWSIRETTRTLTFPLIRNDEPVAVSRLLKTSPPPTALELAEHYHQIMTENGHFTNKELATSLGKSYRTVRSIMKVLSLAEPAKKLLREAGQDPLLRPRLSRGLLEPIPVRGTTAHTQLARIRKHLRT